MAGFTLIEVMVVVMIIGLITAMIAPNLGAFVPKARLDAASKEVVANIDHLRSESRIQGKRCALELDLEHARWRQVFPAEERLTTDQDIEAFQPKIQEWTDLQEGVQFVSAGNRVEGFTNRGVFPIIFDHNGFTGDYTIVMRLIADPTMVWTINIRGLTGQCEVVEDFQGQEHAPDEVGEGSF